MNNIKDNNPQYGNWVSTKFIYIPCVLGLILLGFSFILPVLIIPAGFFLITLIYFLYARNKFSSTGGDLQAKVRHLIFDYLDWDGRGEVLDIGCGNGPLAIELARRHKDCKVVGIDYWGAAWDYSQKVCEHNADLAHVSDRITFQKASASTLPFEEAHFDAVVSNFVFHEVKDTKDKRQLIKEALRTVKKGGAFSFQDLFLVESIYGDTDDLLEEIKSWGIESVHFVKTNDKEFIPQLLKLPFMLGEIGIIYGRK